jgi:hypothetical protein
VIRRSNSVGASHGRGVSETKPTSFKHCYTVTARLCWHEEGEMTGARNRLAIAATFRPAV